MIFKILVLVGMIVLIAVLIALGAFLTIAALNTLFGLGIAHNVWTYASVVWLGMFIRNQTLGKYENR